MPVKSIVAARERSIDGDRDLQRRAVIHRIGERAVADPVDHPADAFLGIVHHVAHIGAAPPPARSWRPRARSSCTPFSLAAICALMSATLTSGLRAG